MTSWLETFEREFPGGKVPVSGRYGRDRPPKAVRPAGQHAARDARILAAAADGERQDTIAAREGVSQTTVSRVICRARAAKQAVVP